MRNLPNYLLPEGCGPPPKPKEEAKQEEAKVEEAKGEEAKVAAEWYLHGKYENK